MQEGRNMAVGFLQLQQIPNQIFPFFIGDSSMDIQLKTVRDDTFISVIQNEVPIFSNIKCFTDQFALPYEFNDVNFNFIWISKHDTPHYTRFGKEDQLMYVTW